MTNKNFKFLIGLIIAGAILSFAGFTLVSQASPESMTRKIVVFKSDLNESAREALIQKIGGAKIKDLNLIDGKAVLLSSRAAKDLAKQPGVLRIDDDVEVFALGEIIPWGVDRIDADKVWPLGNTGNSIRVGIIDTGISTTHPDLKANLKGGINTINTIRSYNDDNGHGSHVAGIVAAVDNDIGVIGVGPQVNLYAIKVLNAAGSGYLSDVIEGLDWAIKNKIQVVNMSLGTSANVQSFYDAVVRVNQAGIIQVGAAGNSGGSVIYPAAYPEVIAVSATDKTDTIASWSSRGQQIDLAAPGVSIYSTYKGTRYATLSGTSMAAPHVTGAAALVLTQTAKCDTDLNGSCSPAEVQQRLEATAEDLGAAGKDNLYGSGLVDAEKAITQ